MPKLNLIEQEPKGIHLIYGQDPSSQVNILWWTIAPTTSALVYYSLVDLENDDVPIESLTCNHNMISKGYIARNLTYEKYIHRVYLSDLLPNRRYCYEITSGHASSHIYSFRTAALSIEIGIKDENYIHSTFLVNGNDLTPSNSQQVKNSDKSLSLSQATDANDSYKSENLSFLIESIKFQMTNKQINAFINLPKINLKEYVKNNKQSMNILSNSLMYDKDFLDYYTEILSNMQLIPSLGQSKDEKTQTLFKSMFPLNGLSKQDSFIYGLNANGVHFVTFSLDYLISFINGDKKQLDQLVDSLEKDLIKANQNRHLVPWLVVILDQELTGCSATKTDLSSKKIDFIKKK